MSGRTLALLPSPLSLAVLVLASSLDAQPPVVLLTSQQDHDWQMQLLKISGFPAGPDAYQAATYDEAKATPYATLPDPLVMNDGYHWMAGNFMKYGGRWDTLPVDSHELIAMAAPRPLFLGAGSGPLTNPDGTFQLMTADDPRCQPSRGPCATQAVNIMDAWADAKGTFMAGVGADPVYRLLGKKGLGTTEFPKMETGLMEGVLAFRQHAGPHTDAPNWPVFIEFADRQFTANK